VILCDFELLQQDAFLDVIDADIDCAATGQQTITVRRVGNRSESSEKRAKNELKVSENQPHARVVRFLLFCELAFWIKVTLDGYEQFLFYDLYGLWRSCSGGQSLNV
jgi:hypothetical protein